MTQDTSSMTLIDALFANQIPVLLAPMSGVTDQPFRLLAHKFGATRVVSEMLASRELVTGGKDAVRRLKSDDLPDPMVQIAGREAEWMAHAAKIAETSGARIIDINMGCPAKKVTSGYSGSALMRNLDHAETLIDATVKAVSVPVTLKMRLGWDEDSINAPELAKRAEALDVKMVTVHGRTRNQFYKGTANWQRIRDVVEAVDIPVIVNGDIHDLQSAQNAMHQSGANGIMVGRAAYGRPWIAGDLHHALNSQTSLQNPETSLPTRRLSEIVPMHYQMMLDHYGAILGPRNARKHLGWYMDLNPMRDQERETALKQMIMREEAPEKVKSLLAERFNPERLASQRLQSAA